MAYKISQVILQLDNKFSRKIHGQEAKGKYMDTGDGFSIDTDLMSLLNSQTITSESNLQEALTQIEGRYRVQLEEQVIDTLKQAQASHRRITGLWLHLKDWTEGLDQSTQIAADKIRLVFADLPEAVPANTAAGTISNATSNTTDMTSTSAMNPATSLGNGIGQILNGFSQGLQQIPQLSAQIPQMAQGLGQPLQQAFQPMQALMQEITHALDAVGKMENINTGSEFDTPYDAAESGHRSGSSSHSDYRSAETYQYVDSDYTDEAERPYLRHGYTHSDQSEPSKTASHENIGHDTSSHEETTDQAAISADDKPQSATASENSTETEEPTSNDDSLLEGDITIN